ncbi:recombinase family protein [Clostridium saccharobutylicum]|uniref:recombinase family protein n=1 Tax=Clostridium saccharobutylicum TaxID=169679 RepID=UPI001F007379
MDTDTPTGRFMLTIFGAVAQLEREYILARQKEGIEIAKAEGKYKGRKSIDIDRDKFVAIYNRWRAVEITARASMKELGIKASTFYRRVARYEINEM